MNLSMRKIIGLCLLLQALNLNAQEGGEQKLGSWYKYVGNNLLSEKVSLLTEVQLRYYEQGKTFNQSVLRSGIDYKFSDNTHVFVGYTYRIIDDSFEEVPRESNIREHRISEQFILKNKIWEVLLQHRYGLEQRFFDFGDRTEVQHRGRYQLQLTLPLTDVFFVNLSEEVLLNLQGNIFDQNRLYAGLGIHITHNLSLETGFLKTHFSNYNHERLVIGVTFSPNLIGVF